MKSQEFIQSRFRGALLGVLVGDCFGAPYERRKAIPSKTLNNIQELVCSAKILRYTDDTAMSISTCKSLIEHKKLDAKHLARLFAESYFREPKRGYGPAVRTVFKRLRKIDYQDPFGPASLQFDGSGSFGNGAAMRCNGIALFAHKMNLNDRQTIDLTENCSRITHSHAHGINGAVLLVLAIRYVLNLADGKLNELEFLDYLIKKMSEIEDPSDKVFTQKLQLTKEFVEKLFTAGEDTSQIELVDKLGNNVSAQGSVPLAIYSFLRGNFKQNDSYNIEGEFKRTLHWAISCGGDTDTIGSMACGLSGAYLGMNKVPKEFYEKCEYWREMMRLADELSELESV